MFSLVFVLVGRLAGRGCGSHDGLTGQGLQSVVDDCCVFVWVMVDDGSTVDKCHLSSSILSGRCCLSSSRRTTHEDRFYGSMFQEVPELFWDQFGRSMLRNCSVP